MKYFLIIIALLFSSFAEAQTSRNPCYNTGVGTGVNGSTNCVGVGTSTPLPVTGTFTPSGTQTISGTVATTQSGTWNVNTNGYSFTNITTNANTVVKASAGTFAGIIINTAGLTSSVVVYNDTSCSSTKIGTFSSLAQTSLSVNAIASTGICVTTAGGTPADITILWR
jgi:hypothetical protein